MKEEIKDYLDKKIYGAKKTALAIALCGAATLALTGCGNQESLENPTQIEQQVEEQNMYRLHTPDGYFNFDIKRIGQNYSNGGYETTYYTTNDFIITFRNDGCTISDKGYNVLASYLDAYMEKIDLDLEKIPYDSNENASNPLSYETTEMESSIDLEN